MWRKKRRRKKWNYFFFHPVQQYSSFYGFLMTFEKLLPQVRPPQHRWYSVSWINMLLLKIKLHKQFNHTGHENMILFCPVCSAVGFSSSVSAVSCVLFGRLCHVQCNVQYQAASLQGAVVQLSRAKLCAVTERSLGSRWRAVGHLRASHYTVGCGLRRPGWYCMTQVDRVSLGL